MGNGAWSMTAPLVLQDPGRLSFLGLFQQGQEQAQLAAQQQGQQGQQPSLAGAEQEGGGSILRHLGSLLASKPDAYWAEVPPCCSCQPQAIAAGV